MDYKFVYGSETGMTIMKTQGGWSTVLNARKSMLIRMVAMPATLLAVIVLLFGGSVQAYAATTTEDRLSNAAPASVGNQADLAKSLSIGSPDAVGVGLDSLSNTGALLNTNSALTTAGAAVKTADCSNKLKAAASSKNNLKKAGMKFDLSNNKKRDTYMLLRGAGKVRFSVQMTDFKVKKIRGNRKKASFKITWNLEDELDDSAVYRVHKAFKKQGHYWNGMESVDHMFFVDYVTGRNLEDRAFSNGVDLVKKQRIRYSRTSNFVADDGAWFYIVKSWTMAVAVTFPADYRNSCVGVGYGMTYGIKTTSTDWAYLDCGRPARTFYQTSWYRKCKDNLHFKRIV